MEGVLINCAVRGSGPPVLMLHGYPQNHLSWRHVAPALAEDHTVVLADLRGYGDSGKPAPDPAGLVYSKRAMARDQVGLMRRLGFESFRLVGHDRGAICADFRASPGPDLAHDEESIAAGQKIQCPVLVLWGTQGAAGPGYDPPAIWPPYAPDVRGVAVPTGHFVAEEAPRLVVDALQEFFD